jgi:2,3-bisphosphoglycerate-independent phosphoglycerate mutase
MMKYVVLLGDGMSDEPIEALGGKTPLQAAKTPNMDMMAKRGRLGLAHTVPEGYPPGSDVANLSVFGYDPRTCYTGRSPLEAASIGVQLAPEDVAFRLNLVTLTPHASTLYMEDFSAGHITTEEAAILINLLQSELGDDEFQFYTGVGYRHLMVWRGGSDRFTSIPPHDITGKSILEYLPKGDGSERLMNLMNSSQMLFHNHPVNKERIGRGELPAASIWLWGQGKAPVMESYQQRFGLKGAVISAVDLIRGIGIYAGLDIIKVPGATGYINTNYLGKGEATLAALETRDFVFVHVEAPDEAAHSGSLEDKIFAIEQFDSLVVGTVLEGIGRFGEYRILCTPDHPTPVRLMTHTSDPVPFILYGGETSDAPGVAGYDEFSAKAAGLVLENGYQLMELLLAPN